jgi:hypothetical protein
VTALGIRLTLRGGREALTRLILTALSVAVGVGVMLGVIAEFHAYTGTTSRQCWECTTGTPLKAGGQLPTGSSAELWSYTEDFFQGRAIRRLDVSPLGADAATIPGLTAMPAAGHYYVSPALARLLSDTPKDQLADRFPGVQSGVVGRGALVSPDELVVVVGRPAADFAPLPGAVVVDQVSRDREPIGSTNIYRFAFAFGSVALLLPLAILVGTATRLSAARREERYAAMRLVGATSRQVGTIAGIEAFLGAALGTLLGTAGYLLARTRVAKITVTGTPFFPDTVTPTAAGYLAVLIGVPLVSVLAAVWALRRLQYDPLGVSRKATPKPLSAWRLVPIVLGFVLWTAEMEISRGPQSADTSGLVYLCLILVMVGIVLAGPYLTMVGARLLTRFATGASSLLAARRLADDPRAAYRTVSGLTVAVFVGTAVAGLLPTSISAATSGSRAPLNDVLRVRYDDGPGPGAPATPAGSADSAGSGTVGLAPARAAEVLGALHAIPGVSAIPLYQGASDPSWDPATASGPPPSDWHPPFSYVACADAARLPALGSCEPGQSVAVIAADDLFIDNPLRLTLPVVNVVGGPHGGTGARAAAEVPAGTDVSKLAVTALLVTASSHAGLEQARTYLATHVPLTTGATSPDQWSTAALAPMTFGEVAAVRGAMYTAAERMIVFAVVLTLVVAGCGLAVATAGSLVERRRPFTLLRLAGTPLASLYRVVLLESALPLLGASVFAGLTGFAMARVGVMALAPGAPMAFPAGTYALTTTAGLLGALAVIAGSMTLLGRMTRSDTARFE